MARAIKAIDPAAAFEGIGAGGMRDAGFELWRDHTGWASMGPLGAIPRIPKLLATMYWTAFHIAKTTPDLVILVDFGAFNLRLAKTLRRIGYKGRILDVFPPATWLDNERRAREVASVMVPLTAFAHQRDFYQSLGLEIAYFGHPLAAQYAMRASRPAPPREGGTVAILPGSRSGEMRFHIPRLFAAYRMLRKTRPQLRCIIGAADAGAESRLAAAASEAGIPEALIVRGTVAAVREADAAWIASGTAVLEAALSGVPCVSLYVIHSALVRHARRVYRGKFITLPNLILEREAVPEFLQDDATAANLAAAMEKTLRDPSRQYRELETLRTALGPPEALDRCAAFAVALAKR